MVRTPGKLHDLMPSSTHAWEASVRCWTPLGAVVKEVIHVWRPQSLKRAITGLNPWLLTFATCFPTLSQPCFLSSYETEATRAKKPKDPLKRIFCGQLVLKHLKDLTGQTSRQMMRLDLILHHHLNSARILFVGLSSAFNTINPGILHQKLTAMASTCQWITSWLTDGCIRDWEASSQAQEPPGQM